MYQSNSLYTPTINDGAMEGSGYNVETRFTKSFTNVSRERSRGGSNPGLDIDVVFPRIFSVAGA
jgi:hypothetical protein